MARSEYQLMLKFDAIQMFLDVCYCCVLCALVRWK